MGEEVRPLCRAEVDELLEQLDVECVDRHIKITLGDRALARYKTDDFFQMLVVAQAKNIQRDAGYIPHELTIFAGGAVLATYADAMLV